MTVRPRFCTRRPTWRCRSSGVSWPTACCWRHPNAPAGPARAARLTSERFELLPRLPRHDPRSGGEVADIYHVGSEIALAAGELELAMTNARLANDDIVNRQGLPHFGAAHLMVPVVFRGDFDE